MYATAKLALAALAVTAPSWVLAVDQSQVVYALNAGAPSVYVDSQGIHYESDHNDVGEVSFANRRPISGVNEQDGMFYATERYHTDDLHYVITFRGDEDAPKDLLADGDYTLVLKFAETYWQEPDKKVFNVLVNNVTAVANLDIYSKAGFYAAHDEIVALKVKHESTVIEGVHLMFGMYSAVNGHEAPFDGDIDLLFQKIPGQDNPKICAFYIAKGNAATLDIPLPGYYGSEQVTEERERTKADSAESSRYEGTHGRNQWRGSPSAEDDAPSLADEEATIDRPTLIKLLSTMGIISIVLFGRSGVSTTSATTSEMPTPSVDIM